MMEQRHAFPVAIDLVGSMDFEKEDLAVWMGQGELRSIFKKAHFSIPQCWSDPAGMAALLPRHTAPRAPRALNTSRDGRGIHSLSGQLFQHLTALSSP